MKKIVALILVFVFIISLTPLIATADEDQPAPTGLASVTPSTSTATDGKITGTTTAMEFKLSTATKYTKVTGTEITGLAAGMYLVRYYALENVNPGALKTIIVPRPADSADFTYSDNGSSITITGYVGAGGAVIIPSKIAGKSVTSIGDNAFSGKTNLSGIILPSSVTSIGASAFNGCTTLTAAKIPSSVTSIASNAFTGCIVLKIYGQASSYAQTFATAN
jgi:hypothetical protein